MRYGNVSAAFKIKILVVFKNNNGCRSNPFDFDSQCSDGTYLAKVLCKYIATYFYSKTN